MQVHHLRGKSTVVALSVIRAQELCESRAGRPGLPSLISLMVSVDVKQHPRTELRSCVKVEGPSRAPVPNEPTVSVDVKQHFSSLSSSFSTLSCRADVEQLLLFLQPASPSPLHICSFRIKRQLSIKISSFIIYW